MAHEKVTSLIESEMQVDDLCPCRISSGVRDVIEAEYSKISV